MEEAIQLIKPRWSAIFLGAFNGAVRGTAVTAVALGCGMGFSNLWDKCYPEAIAFK